MYSFLVDYTSEHKKAKDVNKNVILTISHNEYKDDLLNQKWDIRRTEPKVKIIG